MAAEKLETSKYLKIFDAYLVEVTRLDGDGLLPRIGRSHSWSQITAQLRKDLSHAKTKFEIGRIFMRLDAAYTNLHAHIDVTDDYNLRSEGKVQLAVSFWPDQLSENGDVNKFILSNVRREYFINLEPSERPQLGDEVVSINGRDMKYWQDENFNFCKYPLKAQCQINLKDNFSNEMLSWNRREPLKMRVKRGAKFISFKVPIVARRQEHKSAQGSSGSEDNKFDLPLPPGNCGLPPERYPNFKLVYQGLRGCAYERADVPDVTLIRIGGFDYARMKYKTDITRVRIETEKFYQTYWKQRAKSTKKLIIDVTGNLGGDIITTWAALFIETGFQDQWVQFKNLKEYEDSQWQKDSFYDDPTKYKFFKNYKAQIAAKKIMSEDFMPATPQFCATDEGSCESEKWPSKQTGFKGDVIIFTDELCISSCVGFVWTMKTYLKDKVKFIGVPDSGDSTYSRAYIEGGIDNSKAGFFIKTIPRPPHGFDKAGADAEYRYTVSTSRQTDEKGNIISGKPQKMDFFSYARWDEDPDMWVARMLEVTIEKIKAKEL